MVVLFTFLLATAAFGQVTGTLVGNATTDGAGLPGVTVTITSPALQGSRTTTTGDGGAYTFPSVPPGEYTVVFELSGMANQTRKVLVPLAGTGRADADMKVTAVTEAITVTATAPAVLETTEMARNFTDKQVALLPVRRNITDTVALAPGVNNNGARNNFTISGSPSYDNLFLVNGVTVNENLRGQPHDLFIEDAIQETTVLTGAISAEYGRFSGGVVSTLTKSGGNEFTGSFRDSISNADWIKLTPIETAAHPDKMISVYEGTLGGFVMKDRIWFFGAGRKTSGAPAVGINPTKTTAASPNGLSSPTITSFQNTIDQKRWEGKLTAQVAPQHSLIASYLDVKTIETNNFFAPIYDPESIVPTRETPNKLATASYSGVITSNLLVEAQWSQKDFAFVGSGGRFTDQIRGTWIADSQARFNAPVFCGVCTNEERNNDSWLGKATYFFNTTSMGTHSIVGGGEKYHETRLVNNYQSASQYQITSTGTAIQLGTTVYPRFDRGSTLTWRPILQLSSGSDLTTKALFLNDKWDFNKNFSFNLGVRYDKNDALDASGNVVSDDSAFAPRLGAIYDVKGDGRFRVNASYSHYTSKIVDGNVGGGAAGAGNPANFNFRYETDPAPGGVSRYPGLTIPAAPIVNPAGTPTGSLVNAHDALVIMFNWFNSLSAAQKAALLTSSTIPGLSTQIDEPISSPYVREYVLGFGSQFTPRAYGRIDFINRDWHDFYATQLDLTTGRFTGTNPVNGATVTGDRAILINDDENLERKYRGVQLTFNWNPARFNVGGGYTWSKLTGNDIPEGDGTAAVTNTFGHFYPEYLNYENRQPSGYLTGDQRHRAKVWVGYDIPLPVVKLNASIIQSYDSGRAFSATANIDPYGLTTPFTNSPASREGNGTTSPYLRNQLGTSATYYFSKRGEFRTEDTTATDLALNLSIPIRRFEIFMQGQVLNVFNEHAVNNIYLGNMDFTVYTARGGGDPRITDATKALKAFNPLTETPVEGVHYTYGPNFGKALTADAYQTPRTYRLAVGLRF
ncbi:MAG TPA: TonB-dependent receptor [Thermoanaerobaculia bacterium]|nr:TonB-dependent receptor [Thermoanaerobaculia bacterium]